jgi:toxin ParE1/3/4
LARRIIWALAAQDDVISIRAYINQFNPAAAVRMANLLIAAADSLSQMPDRGRPIAGGRRELISAWPYVIRYRAKGDLVTILRVRHGARQPD